LLKDGLFTELVSLSLTLKENVRVEWGRGERSREAVGMPRVGASLIDTCQKEV
jgi:hypothetical protein